MTPKVEDVGNGLCSEVAVSFNPKEGLSMAVDDDDDDDEIQGIFNPRLEEINYQYNNILIFIKIQVGS